MTPYTVEPGVLEAPESEHSVLGPSSSERWIECPASVRATKGIVDEGSPFAIEGTAAHAVAEACEANGVRAEHYLGWTVRVRRGDKHTDVECGQEMVDGVQVFLDYVDEFPGESLNESRVDYPFVIEGGFGTMDRAKIEPDGKRVHVFDLKYGKGVPVDATDNPQLKLYAIGMDHTFGWMSEETEEYVVHVVQPRLDSISSWAIRREELLQWGAEVAAKQARKAVDGVPEFKAGSWCTFCKIKSTCMVRASSVFSEIVGDFANLDEAVTEVETLGPAFALTADQAARILHVLPQIKSWCSDLEEFAVAEIAQGRAVGDWKLVEGRASRKWALPEAEVAEVLKAAGVPDDQVWTREIVSVAQAEKIKMLGKKHSVFKDHVVKTKGKPTLAPGSDKRASISVDAATEFDSLD